MLWPKLLHRHALALHVSAKHPSIASITAHITIFLARTHRSSQMDVQTPTQRCPLSALPDELLAHIFDELDVSSLVTVAQTSHRMYAVAVDSICTSFCGIKSVAACFLRTVASLPLKESVRHANQVKHIIWKSHPANHKTHGLRSYSANFTTQSGMV